MYVQELEKNILFNYKIKILNEISKRLYEIIRN